MKKNSHLDIQKEFARTASLEKVAIEAVRTSYPWDEIKCIQREFAQTASLEWAAREAAKISFPWDEIKRVQKEIAQIASFG